MRKLYGVAVLVTALTFGSAAKAQPPTPGVEHDHFKQLVGTWDATVKTSFAPGESKGTMVYKMDVGGIWLVGNYKGQVAGMPFEGKGLDTYDPRTKKYVGVWVDSMSTTPMIMTGDLDKQTGTMTMEGEAPGMDGKMQKMKSVTKMEGKDAIAFTMYGVGPDGKDSMVLTIHYKRKS